MSPRPEGRLLGALFLSVHYVSQSLLSHAKAGRLGAKATLGSENFHGGVSPREAFCLGHPTARRGLWRLRAGMLDATAAESDSCSQVGLQSFPQVHLPG
jgi:hypothetical protein